MANFPDILSFILGGVFIILIFAVTYAYLKPHQLHSRRPVSTILLKSSFLLYLITLMLVVYFSAMIKGGLEEVFMGVEFFAFLVVLFVPSIGIFARKLGYFAKIRENYNYFFTIINVMCILALILMYIV